VAIPLTCRDYLAHACMVQTTVCSKGDDELASALYAVVLQLARLPVDVPVDKAGLAVLHETRRLGKVRPSDLAAQMRLDLSTISRHLRTLEQQGMVQRSTDPDDARALRISVTPGGEEVLTRLLSHRAATIRDAIAQWPETERSTLGQLLRRLADDLYQSTEACSSPLTQRPTRTEKVLEET
jgi:DNA-binding MarR family transcriptional regulator